MKKDKKDKTKWISLYPRIAPAAAGRFQSLVAELAGGGGQDEHCTGALFLWSHLSATVREEAIRAGQGLSAQPEAYWDGVAEAVEAVLRGAALAAQGLEKGKSLEARTPQKNRRTKSA